MAKSVRFDPAHSHEDGWIEMSMLSVGQEFEHPDGGRTRVEDFDTRNDQLIPDSSRPLSYDEGFVRLVDEQTTEVGD